MPENIKETPIRHMFLDTHRLTTAQRERLVKRLERLLSLRFHTGLDRPGDGTATLNVHWELESIERVEALVWRLIKRQYKPRLMLDEAIGRLRALHHILPPPDVRQESARRDEQKRKTGSRLASALPSNPMHVYPLWPDCLSGDDFDPETGEPPFVDAEILNRLIIEHYPRHQNEVSNFIQILDELLRRYVRIFIIETRPRWQKGSCSRDAIWAAFRYFHYVIEENLCDSNQTA